QRAKATEGELRKLATPERNGVYWALAHNTPFYGWGHAGRVESTAMTILALSAVDSTFNRSLIDQGILWLLHEKDRYGVWYSGQATVDVLKALLEADASRPSSAPVTFAVRANGRIERSAVVSPLKFDAPTFIDISDGIVQGNNSIEIENSTDSLSSSAQVV